MRGLIFTYVLTYGGALASLTNPFIGLLVYVCFAIIKPERTWPWSVPQGNYSRIVAIAFLIGWAAAGFGRWQFGRAKQIVTTLLLFVVWMVASASAAPDSTIAWDFAEIFFKTALPVLAGMTLVDSYEKLRALAWTIVVSTGLVAFFENEKYYAGLVEVGDNFTAHQALVGVGMAFFLGVYTTALWKRLIAFGCAALLVHTVMFNMSRGAMVGVAATVVMILLVIPKYPKYIVPLVLALAVVGRLAGDNVREEFSTIFSSEDERDASAQSRFDLWADMFDATLNHPILGLGPSHWPLVAEQYGWPAGKEGHGLWSQVTAEFGFPGGVLYLGFFVLTLIRLWPIARPARDRLDDESARLARMAITSIFGFVCEAQFGSFKAMEVAYYAVLLGAATIAVSSVPGPTGQPVSERPLSNPSKTARLDQESQDQAP
ncbi:MAG: O-antigen ligase family protein [Planctomycetes bacterium]|nr:O-antigen ligase family protein [Planctomycetota bacterium]